MSKVASIAAIVGLLIVTLPSAAGAQLTGRHVAGDDFAPIDASALGDTRPASISLFTSARIGVGGGGGLAGGAMRGYLSADRDGASVGGGYARTFAERRLAGPLVGTFGGELVGGYNHVFRRTLDDAAALRLTMPLGFALGDPSGTSFGLYVAPYAEAGVARSVALSPEGCNPFCSYVQGGHTLLHALGTGIGMRASFRRFGTELIFRDIAPKGRGVSPLSDGVLGFTYRLGGAQLP